MSHFSTAADPPVAAAFSNAVDRTVITFTESPLCTWESALPAYVGRTNVESDWTSKMSEIWFTSEYKIDNESPPPLVKRKTFTKLGGNSGQGAFSQIRVPSHDMGERLSLLWQKKIGSRLVIQEFKTWIFKISAATFSERPLAY